MTFVVHDWGSALGYGWAKRHPGAVKGIAYKEAIMPSNWNDMLKEGRQVYQALRSPEGDTRISGEERRFQAARSL